MLAKGPLGFLPALVFVCFQAISPQRVRIGRRHAMVAGLLLAGVVTPWHVYMLAKFGRAFYDDYVVHHLVDRATETIEQHSGAWFYYFRLLTGRDLCCSAELVAIACVAPLFDRSRLAAYRTLAPLLSIGILMVVISSMETKLAWYMLPLYPYAAVLVGRLFDTCWRPASDRTRPPSSRIVPFAASLLVLGVVTLYAGRDMRNIVGLERGRMQMFFEKAIVRCGEGLVYADPRLPGEVRYLLRRYDVPRGAPGTSGCFIGWKDTESYETPGGACSRVDHAEQLALWECAGPSR